MDLKKWLTQGRGEQYYSDIQEDIWQKKYRHNGENFDAWLDRVSGGDIAVRRLIEQRKFLFGGRILATRGIDKTATYSNCYVVAPPKDSIKGIYNTAYEIAQTLAYGGGAGVDIGTLRPSGATVANQATTTSGAVSFLELFAMTSQIIGQNGRRGALMVSMPVWHPDVLEFIDLKLDLTKATKANLSLRINDEFIQCVQNNMRQEITYQYDTGGETHTFTKIMNCREVFHKICRVAWETGEVGMLYWDNIKSYTLTSAYPDFSFAGVNPCGEQPLPAYGSCLLGSLNISEFIFDGMIDFIALKDAAQIATRALNDVQDEGIDRHPLPQNKEVVKKWRQIGLGVMGVADALLKCRCKYGSVGSLVFIKEIFRTILSGAFATSSNIGKVRGNYGAFNSDNIKASNFYLANAELLENAWDGKHLRNSQLLTIAPTGTISTFLGVSGGIEPLFATHYTRKTETLHGEDKTYKVAAPIIKELFGDMPDKEIKAQHDYVVTAHDINPMDRIDFQATAQKYIDASISSTINLPNSATVDDIGDIYEYGHKVGLKGITVYRDGCSRDGILHVADDVEEIQPNEKDCPSCGVGKIYTGGCSICLSCGHSECG